MKLVGGKYEIISELGRGGMGVVYKAEQSTLGRTVAIKALSADLATNDQFLARFQQEARVVARMGSHENIVQVYDVESHEGNYYIIMEYVEGRSLGDRIKAGEKIPLDDALRIVRQTARALQHAHERGIVHRDVKPDNVMLTNTGKVKVMDFGIARVENSSVKTQTGMSIGTPHYMSPEQIEGRRTLDARSDVYSLAVMLYYLVVGKLPFNEDNPFTLAMKHISEPPPPPSMVNPSIDPVLEGLILKGLEKDPAHRFQSASEFEQELSAYSHADGLGAAAPNMSIMDMPQATKAAIAARARAMASDVNVRQAGRTLAGPTPQPQQRPPHPGATARTPAHDEATKMAPQRARPTAAKKSGALGWIILFAGVAVVGGAIGFLVLAPEQTKALIDRLKGQAVPVVATPTPAPTQPPTPTPEPTPVTFDGDPDAAVLARLVDRLDGAGYDGTALRNIDLELKNLLATYPRSPQLRDLTTKLASRDGRAEAYRQTTDELIELLKAEDFGRARSLLSRNASTFDVEAARKRLYDRMEQAEKAYIERQQKSANDALAKGDEAGLALARAAIAAGSQKFPDNPTWGEIEARILDLELTLSARADAVARQAEVEASFQKAIETEHYADARTLLARIEQEHPNATFRNDAKRRLNDSIRGTVNKLQREAIQAEAGEQIDKAIEILDRALELDPSNLALLGDKSRLSKGLESQTKANLLVVEARKLAAAKDFGAATRKANEALALDPVNVAARAMIEDIRNMEATAGRVDAANEPRITDSAEQIARRKQNAPNGFVYVPGGFYRIGNDTGPSDERPSQILRVEGFYISMYEVSVSEYDEYLKSNTGGVKTRPSLVSGTSFDRPDYPVIGVSYIDARDFARYRSMRLPTEIEWEVAARTIDAYTYPTGNTWDPRKANTSDNGSRDGFSQVAPVRSPFKDGTENAGYREGNRSTHHMTGNVAEWTDSMFVPYSGSNASHPLFHNERYRVVRGGTYLKSDPGEFMASKRQPERESTRSRNDLGFRLASTPQ